MKTVDSRRDDLKSLISKGNAFWDHPWPIASLLNDHFERNSIDEVSYFEMM